MQDRPNEIFVDDDNRKYEIVEIVDKRKCEQGVSECKKCQTLIKTVLGRNIAVISE